MLRLFVTLVLLMTPAFAGPFNVAVEEREEWPEWLRAGIKRAEEDFNAVLQGEKPVHAKPIKDSFMLDGGTGVYQGEGYTLTVFKRITTVLGVPGFTYGPVLRFKPEILSEPISSIQFYSGAEFSKLTEGTKKMENKPDMATPSKPSV